MLVFSPTVTIKNQWIDRYIKSFTNYEELPDYISTDIYNLKGFNAVTYQALHYAYKKKKVKEEVEETDDIIKEDEQKVSDDVIKSYDIVEEIKNKKITTIILDEAHHLKAEWWNSLKKVIDELGNVNIISLTATPPYDSEKNEWNRYIELCGDIDAEVSVPELVKVNNLCPHQDYIYFNTLSNEEKEKLKEYEKKLQVEIENIKRDDGLKEAILAHRFIKEPYEYEEELLDNIEYYSSMLIFLKNANEKIPKENIKILGGTSERVPPLTLEWLEILIKNIIINDRKSYEYYEDKISEIESKLKSLGVVENSSISFTSNKKLQDYFVNSKGKLESISKIYKLEEDNLKENLRMVILTDYIRKDYMEEKEEDELVNKIGVFPIFNKLIEDYGNIDMGILTGQIFVIPKKVKDNLYGLIEANNLDNSKIKYEELKSNDNYLVVKMPDSIRNKVMSLISKLFANGLIKVIVGTKSLLGEGWDEPSINTLILASFVGSFMLSNQMRGRAIRVYEKYDKKVSNIWHLVCLNDDENSLANPDLEMLKRRFKAFPGINYNSPIVLYGISRIGSFIMPPYNDEKIENINNVMSKKATDRTALYNAWKEVSSVTSSENMIQSLTEMDKEEKIKKSWFINKTFVILLVVFLIVLILSLFLKIPFVIKLIEGVIGIILLVKIINMFRNSQSKNMIKLMGQVVLNSLIRCKFIKTSRDKIKLQVKEKEKSVMCYITGATAKEANLFSSSLAEVFSKTTNERYIIARLNKNLKQINEYYNVPNVLSQNKEMAEVFSKYFKQKIGDHDLIYTKTADGRKMLLKARMKNITLKNVFSKDDEMSIFR